MSAETYKGIDFVRISNLPEEQKNHITQTIDRHKIIKILRGNELLHDCVQVNDYAHWMKENFNKEVLQVIEDLGLRSFPQKSDSTKAVQLTEIQSVKL